MSQRVSQQHLLLYGNRGVAPSAQGICPCRKKDIGTCEEKDADIKALAIYIFPSLIHVFHLISPSFLSFVLSFLGGHSLYSKPALQSEPL